MIKLSRRLDYAILAVSHLATRGRSTPLSARALADATRIPPAILANILKDLHRAALVRSARGVHGGYELAVAPEELSVGGLLRALEGDVRLVECVPSALAGVAAGGVAVGETPSRSSCQIESSCPIKAPLRRVHERIHEVLNGLTFDQLVAEAFAAPFAGPLAGPLAR
ncbi:MAG: Rrf2 family transcriptional regulator [Planctomycetes bacterium]|nr:Rrf2 family transcriptional regulator [Planctomycetota bacterium]